MFCVKCGQQFEGNFCPNCGTPAFSRATGESQHEVETHYPSPPLGEYKASPGALIIAADHLVIVGKKISLKSYNLRIPYCAITSAVYKTAPLGGSLRISWDAEKADLQDIPIKQNIHTFEFTPGKFKEFASAYAFLEMVASINTPETSQPICVQPQVMAAPKTELHLSKRQRIKENKKNGIACCPKCGSTSITANKKGYGVGKAVVGASLIGEGVGLIAGTIGSKKVIITCLNCGHQWKP